jgi:hypothetical protein
MAALVAAATLRGEKTGQSMAPDRSIAGSSSRGHRVNRQFARIRPIRGKKSGPGFSKIRQ